MNARRVSYYRVPVATKGNACRTREIAECPLLKTIRIRYILLHWQCSAVVLFEVVFPAPVYSATSQFVGTVPCPRRRIPKEPYSTICATEPNHIKNQVTFRISIKGSSGSIVATKYYHRFQATTFSFSKHRTFLKSDI